MVVVLPAPFGPRRPRISPGRISNEMPSTAVKSPNRFIRPWTSTIGMGMGRFGEDSVGCLQSPLVQQKFPDLVWQMAGLATLAQDLFLMFGLPVMAPKAILHGLCSKGGAFRMIGVVRLAVGSHMPTGDDDRIALDGLPVHHLRMTGRAAFSFAPLGEGLHMLPVAHDQPYIFHRWRQIAGRDFGDSKDMLMTT